MFQNISETESEDNSTIDVLQDFLTKEMDMSDSSLAQVKITKAYRQGKTITENRPRLIIATIEEDGKEKLWSHTKKIKGQTIQCIQSTTKGIGWKKKTVAAQVLRSEAT